MANFRIEVRKNGIPAIVTILRGRSTLAKAELAATATEVSAFYQAKLKKAAPKAREGEHLLQKGISVTPVRITGTTWRMNPESKADYTKFVIQGTKGRGGWIYPNEAPRLAVHWSGARGQGAPYFLTGRVRGQNPQPFQTEPTREATELMARKMRILGHELIDIF